VTVPFYTDIEDRGFLDAIREAVEATWNGVGSSSNSNDVFRLVVSIESVSSEALYRGSAGPRRAQSGIVPKVGAHLDLERHVALFPPGRAILTTGASTLRWVGDRAIVLGPHDLSPHVLAHEVGHALGFPDAYFRGYRDLGSEGFEVSELSDLGDIMGAPGSGPVLPRHYHALIAGKARVFLNASLRLFQERRYDDSIAAARDAIALKPDYAAAFNNLAAAYAGLSRWDEAIAAATEALRFDPDLQIARNNLRWAEANKADADRAGID
jgi:tetratricopeptide (TPR) repeat protein